VGGRCQMVKNSHYPHGFYRFNETDMMLPRVFGIGKDPCPPNMRDQLTTEEFLIYTKMQKEIMLEHQRKVANGELEY